MDFEALGGVGFLYAFLIMSLASYSQYVVLRSGVFSMATAGFMAIGAYAVAIATVRLDLSPILAMAIGILASSLCGLGVGAVVGRLRGVYQGIATLSFVLVLQQLLSLGVEWTGGPFGIAGIPLFAELGVLVVSVVLVLIFVLSVEISTTGRAHAAIRLDEVAAASLGTNVAKANLIAMTFSGMLGGLAGAMLAGNQFGVDPSAFGFHLVIGTLAAVIVGGYGSFIGPLIGSAITVALPLLFGQHQLLSSTIVSLLMLATLALAPNGVASMFGADSEAVLKMLRGKGFGAGKSRSLEGKNPNDEAPAILTVENISRAYGAINAVSDVSLSISRGQIVGLIGPNGAGKSSVINILAGLTALDSGNVSLNSLQIGALPAHQVERLGIVRTFQECRLFVEQSVMSNVLFAAAMGRTPARRRQLSDMHRARAVLDFARCEELEDRRAGDLPYAFQRRVEIARALACEPKFILLDEPAAGMTQSETDALGDMLKATAALDIGLLVVDHNVPWILSLCDFIYVQHLGRIIASGTPDEVRENPLVIAAYIGEQITPRRYHGDGLEAAGNLGHD